ncbi:protein kinase domain-containing protein [Slackia heliotrinireducens]|uniref:protein kinase domain-containing protein n=1 Tax=Slackia heliotrinireducens TaxID=84110 RepID=UPI003315D91F
MTQPENTSLSDMRILELDSFEVPFPMSESQQERYRRRFLTLLVPEGSDDRGGSGYVCKVANPEGETFAMKRVLRPMRTPSMDEASYKRTVTAQTAAFRREFENQQRLSGLKGFPKLYGYGMAEGEPLIVMEWVEGETCKKAAGLRAVDPKGTRVEPVTVAKLGMALFDLIARFEYLDDSFAHRDISPNNIMLRTDEKSVSEQVESGEFDLCLIDFGSSTQVNLHQDPSFTRLTSVVRRATPEYAPPEMLTNDLPNLDRLRRSPLIDVYAISSVLYELLCGETPYRLGKLSEDPGSYYRYKLEHAIPLPSSMHIDLTPEQGIEGQPELIEAYRTLSSAGAVNTSQLIAAANVVDQQLGRILLKGLANEQDSRAQVWEMRGMLERFVDNYTDNIVRRYRGQMLLPFIDVNAVAPVQTQQISLGAPVRGQATVLRATGQAQFPTGAATQHLRSGGVGRTMTATPSSTPLVRDEVRTKRPITAPVIMTASLIAAVSIIVAGCISGIDASLTLFNKTVSGTIGAPMAVLFCIIPPLLSVPFYYLGESLGSKLLVGTCVLIALETAVLLLVHITDWTVYTAQPVAGVALASIAVFMTIGALWAIVIRRRS